MAYSLLAMMEERWMAWRSRSKSERIKLVKKYGYGSTHRGEQIRGPPRAPLFWCQGEKAVGMAWYGIQPPCMMEERWMAWRSRSKSERVKLRRKYGYGSTHWGEQIRSPPRAP
jgi:hypothetical protein